MLKSMKRKVARIWYPDQTAVRDRWGEVQNRVLTTPEFAPKGNRPGDVLKHMRWGFGLM